MSNFNPMDFLGPRFVDGDVRGDKVFEGSRCVVDDGHFKTLGPKLFNIEIGRVSPLPFDNTVKDLKGNKIGVLESGPGCIKTLRRW